MSAQNFWSQKVVHFIFQSFDSISLKQTYCILYGKYCSVKCRKRIRKFLQKQILSERTFLVIHTRSLFSPPSANKLRQLKFYEGEFTRSDQSMIMSQNANEMSEQFLLLSFPKTYFALYLNEFRPQTL